MLEASDGGASIGQTRRRLAASGPQYAPRTVLVIAAARRAAGNGGARSVRGAVELQRLRGQAGQQLRSAQVWRVVGARAAGGEQQRGGDRQARDVERDMRHRSHGPPPAT